MIKKNLTEFYISVKVYLIKSIDDTLRVYSA